MEQNDLIRIASRFAVAADIVAVEPMGSGLINDTYKVITAGDAPDYVLQRVNNAIFKDVALLQHNIEVATAHIRAKLVAAGVSDIDRKVLTLVPLKDSAQTWCVEDGKYWRMTILITDSYTKEEVTEASSYDAGRAFGEFEAMLADLPETLGETIPDFHNMELRSRQLREAVAADPVGRMAEPEVREMLAFIEKYDEDMCLAERLYREGKLPKRIAHCDAKVPNVLFDAEGNVLCVIDLDTLMPGFIFSDVGDFMRTAASTLPEDDPQVDKVAFKIDIFKAFVKGYLETATFLTEVEKENLPYAPLRFQYMQAVRFFADYINGDTYYKIKYPEHNLVRTRNQLALFRSTLASYDEMKRFVAEA